MTLDPSPEYRPTSGPRTGRIVGLKAITPPDYGFVVGLELDLAMISFWRHSGKTPSSDEILRTLWEGTLCQFLVYEKSSLRLLGIVNCHNADFRNGIANLAVIGEPSSHGSAAMIEGLALLVEYVFRTWPFRKLYAETLEINAPQFASSFGRMSKIEGRLEAVWYHDGRYWDKLILSVCRDTWMPFEARLRQYWGHGEPSEST